MQLLQFDSNNHPFKKENNTVLIQNNCETIMNNQNPIDCQILSLNHHKEF